MCGIVGCIGRSDVREVLLSGLAQLEYRGYDSAGIALADRRGTDVVKRAGELSALRSAVADAAPTGRVGVGHTRWSTHGRPTDANAHPHTDSTGEIAVVHNGIIDNYETLRADLAERGHEFRSETDTEVVPRLFEEYRDAADGPAEAFRRAVDRLEGSYALAAVVAGQELVLGARSDSPLVVGVGDGASHLGSDVPAFLKHTDRVVYVDDGEFVELRPDGYAVTDAEGRRLEKPVETVEWDIEETGKGGYDHYMLKEIHEQPTALRQALSGRVDELAGEVTFEELAAIEAPSRVQFVACGTSYHAAVYAATLFRRHGVPAEAYLANEYATSSPPIDDELVVGVTQSGETADTLAALRAAASHGADTMAVTNVVGSTAARECDDAVYLRAGPEIGVAATKTFTSQLVTLALLCRRLGAPGPEANRREFLSAVRDLPGQLQAVLDDSNAEAIATEVLEAEGRFFIGRGYDYPVALEGALKFKEITYEHAEGFAGGELKHGTLALVTENTPVFAVVTGEDESARKTVGNVKEVEARDAPVVAVTDGRTDVARYADRTLEVPETHPCFAPLLANTQLQLVAYHVADALGRSIDKPRHLAKSVTVE